MEKAGATMIVLDCRIPSYSWTENGNVRGGHAPLLLNEAGDDASNDPAWDDCVAKIDRLQFLGDGWDGADANCPSAEIVYSTIQLVNLFHRRAVPIPSRIAPGLNGEVILEWQFPDGTYAEVEVVRPYFAEVMVVEPDKSTKHWTLPTE